MVAISKVVKLKRAFFQTVKNNKIFFTFKKKFEKPVFNFTTFKVKPSLEQKTPYTNRKYYPSINAMVCAGWDGEIYYVDATQQGTKFK